MESGGSRRGYNWVGHPSNCLNYQKTIEPIGCGRNKLLTKDAIPCNVNLGIIVVSPNENPLVWRKISFMFE